MIIFGAGVKVVWFCWENYSERCGRQTNHEFSRQIVILAPQKILDNVSISRIDLVHVDKNELISHISISHDKRFII